MFFPAWELAGKGHGAAKKSGGVFPCFGDSFVKQLVQHLRSGVLELLEIPCPQAGAGQLLIQTRASLISAGTERFLVEFGKASLWQKARQNPDRVRQVWNKIKTDGLWPTLEAVFAKLDEPLPLGYCNAGVVLEVGAGVANFAAGDRVVSNGGHAHVVAVPKNLCAKIPDNVSDEEASYAVLSAIGLQGIRLLQPGIGDNVAVFGLGLIGLVTVQMLVNSGVRVLGIDVDPQRLALAQSLGAEVVNVGSGGDPIAAGLGFSQGEGVDGVLITASAKQDQIVHQAAEISRKRGKIVLVGVVNLNLDRADFYKKELTFQVSCSYGPGRYDPNYEDRGLDYPYPYVRWTEQRNIAAVLEQMSRGKLNVRSLISSRIPFDDAEQAYQLLSQDRNQLGIVLHYPAEPVARHSVVATPRTDARGRASATLQSIPPVAGTLAVPHQPPSAATSQIDTVISLPAADHPTRGVGSVRLGMIGAGGFATRVLLPAIKPTGVQLAGIASARGLSAAHAARKFGFATSTSDYHTILADPSVNAVCIMTRHQQHAGMVVEALQAGKHVFVEKPLAIDQAGLAAVAAAHAAHPDQQLLVGFNRRFSPHAVTIQKLLATRSEPATVHMLINAGALPGDHWTVDKSSGGGRIIGEGCHWFDLLSFLLGQPITAVQANAKGSADTAADHQSLTLSLADGSVGVLQYLVNGHKSFAKERITIFCQGQVLELDNFRSLTGYGWPKFSKQNLWAQDKGHHAEMAQFLARVASGGPQLIPFASLWNTTQATFAAVTSAPTGDWTAVAPLPVQVTSPSTTNPERVGQSNGHLVEGKHASSGKGEPLPRSASPFAQSGATVSDFGGKPD
ncbi:MAG: bi-domain-containing oxidoreductase [Pirellulales bacterium]|nr:bi-domain-containing oxidoreductase [Pirellulales bacterium]